MNQHLDVRFIAWINSFPSPPLLDLDYIFDGMYLRKFKLKIIVSRSKHIPDLIFVFPQNLLPSPESSSITNHNFLILPSSCSFHLSSLPLVTDGSRSCCSTSLLNRSLFSSSTSFQRQTIPSTCTRLPHISFNIIICPKIRFIEPKSNHAIAWLSLIHHSFDQEMKSNSSSPSFLSLPKSSKL